MSLGRRDHMKHTPHVTTHRHADDPQYQHRLALLSVFFLLTAASSCAFELRFDVRLLVCLCLASLCFLLLAGFCVVLLAPCCFLCVCVCVCPATSEGRSSCHVGSRLINNHDKPPLPFLKTAPRNCVACPCPSPQKTAPRHFCNKGQCQNKEKP